MKNPESKVNVKLDPEKDILELQYCFFGRTIKHNLFCRGREDISVLGDEKAYFGRQRNVTVPIYSVSDPDSH
jgi:hypothetical protein